MRSETILYTGGSGLLGGEIRRLLAQSHYPTSSEFDVTDYWQIESYLS